MLKRPLFYDNFLTGTLYRDFSSVMDISLSEDVIDEITAFDELLHHLDLPISSLKHEGLVTYSNLLLTVWARYFLGLPEEPKPIPQAEFRTFYEALWEPGGKTKKIRQSIKAAFLSWLADRTRFNVTQLSEKYGDYLERMFAQAEEEYGNVDPKDIDPKYMTLFLLVR